MKFAGYKRAKTESEAKEASAALRSEIMESGHDFVFFAWDLTMGQKGFLRVIRAAQSGRVQGIVVEELKDLGRDLVSLIKTLHDLLHEGVTVRVAASWVTIDQPEDVGDRYRPESRMVNALMAAHTAYSNDNRKIGIAAAKAAGASVGRPAGIGLDDVQEVIAKLMSAKDGALPSTRDLAKEIGCSNGKAAQIMKQYRTKREQDEQSTNASSERSGQGDISAQSPEPA